MSRKAIIFCISVIVVLVAGVAVAVSVLYSGVGNGSGNDNPYAGDSRYGLFQAVPSDAVLLSDFRSFGEIGQYLGRDAILGQMARDSKAFSSFIDLLAGSDGTMKSSRAVLSFHYTRDLVPLLVIDAGRSGTVMGRDAAKIIAMADSAGLYSRFLDCNDVAVGDSYLKRRNLLLISASGVLVQSSERHISQGVSVLSLDGFHDVASYVGGEARLFISNANADKLIGEVLGQPYRKYSDFFRHFSDWVGFSLAKEADGSRTMGGWASYGAGADDFMNILLSSSASASHMAEVLPSYTVFAASLPMDNPKEYISAYCRYADVRGDLAKYMGRHKELKSSAGIGPKEWADMLNIKEVGTASFYVGGRLESIVLVRAGSNDVQTILKGTGVTSLKGYSPKAHPYLYKGFAASLFGKLFSVSDESFFTFVDGWIVAGSEAAVGEYVAGRALENPLASYLADAGCPSGAKGEAFRAYFSLTEDRRTIDKVFRPAYAEALASSAEGAVFAPVFITVGKDGALAVDALKIKEMKSKAPVFERDTSVIVPKGPFKVRNSGTGRMNSFYQQDNMYLCLQEENGKGIWGVKFGSPICGRAETVDYFANGKLQIIFASGSKLYLIDRLGRFVKPFPIELGSPVLLGPDVYDFNGKRKYNVMVLHKDNTIQMYNLQGRKPAEWKGITAKETIKDLPEAIKIGGKTWWVTRTSIQTLIFPFYGGEPVTAFEGDRMIRPDSAVTPVKGGVEVTRYDGRKTVIELK